MDFVYKDPFMMTMLKAGISGMKVVKQGQRSKVGVVETKIGDGNNTVVTKWDKASEAAILPILLASGLNVRSEEAGFVGNSLRTDFVWIVDPLDGSKPFVIKAPTSTLSVALFDTTRKRVIASVVLRPVDGFVVFAAEGQGTWSFYYEGDLATDLLAAERCHVNSDDLGKKSIVLVDCYRDFKLKDHPVVEDQVWGEFMKDLFVTTSGMYAFGSNCIFYVLVALGGDGMVGAITTCRGGPHDITVVETVIEAGGYAQGFSNQTGELVEVDPLNALGCNFMVAANTKKNLDALVQFFKKHVG